jgi:phosphoribosylformimino-5-aminoimidazole carboxamide ribotide isomerase
VRDAAQAQKLLKSCVNTVIAGLETLADPDVLRDLLSSKESILVSLDLKAGAPLTPYARWRATPPDGIAQEIIDLGYQRLLLLDLARVGTGAGTGTDDLYQSILCRNPMVQLFVGGGVKTREDLLRLRARGVAGVLLASALHDGTITRADL